MKMSNGYYLALDPGGSTGWATFREDGSGITMGTCTSRTEVYELLRSVKPSRIIMEDWITRQNAQLGGDRLEVVRVIGAVEFYAYLREIPVTLQPNTVKGIAYKWAGMARGGPKRDSHEKDAYCHGVYYLQKAGIRKPQQGRATT
jgi:hypothetical protein